MAVITKRGFPPAGPTISSYAGPFSRPAGANAVVLDEGLPQAIDGATPVALFDWRSQRAITPVEQMVRMLLPFMALQAKRSR
jgi:hypothetical protein